MAAEKSKFGLEIWAQSYYNKQRRQTKHIEKIKTLRIGVMVARLTLDQFVRVQILDPQPNHSIAGFQRTGFFICLTIPKERNRRSFR